MSKPADVAKLDQRLAEVDDLIGKMMSLGAELAHDKGLDERETVLLYADLISKALDINGDPNYTLLPLFVGRLLTCMIMSTSAMMMATQALEALMAQREGNDAG